MTILLIRRAPDAIVPDTSSLPAQVAGHDLSCQHCDSLPALVRCLQHAHRSQPAWVLIEIAAANEQQWSAHGPALCAALDALPTPYIEIARRDADALDTHLHPQHAPVVLVCGSERDEACRLSLAIAARRLQSQEGCAMSIYIVRGPEGSGPLQHAATPLPEAVMKSRVHRALDSGTSIAVRNCRCEQELLEALCVADHNPAEVILLAPGACVRSVRLQRLLPRLHIAYVEVHDDDGHAFDACLPASTGHRLGLAQGYRAQSYVLALEMALEHLCCNEVGNRVHVGT